ncbi:MAG: hypothetical protein WBQ23_05490 [Bacteroidota bacterium]
MADERRFAEYEGVDVAPGLEGRIRKIKRVSVGLAVVLLISLAASHIVQPVPALFIICAFLYGLGYGAASIIFDDRMHALDFRAAFFFPAGLMIIANLTIPEPGLWLFLGIWPGVSAMVLGLILVMLPRIERQILRSIELMRHDREEQLRFQTAGDSKLMAHIRLHAVKMGLIVPLIMLAMMIGLAAFGLYAAFTEDIWGIVLFLMWSPFIIGLIWLLSLRKGAREIRNTASAA